MENEPIQNKLNQNSEYLSVEGLEQVKEKLIHLKTIKRKEIAQRLEYAKGLGDLSENSEYHEAKEAQMENERAILELGDILSRSVILTKAGDTSFVSPGSTVAVLREDSNASMRFVLVGPKETDPTGFKISYESPLGQALLGRKKNESVKVSTPKGEIKYKIIDII
jgi:transcription elongation factor GreA